ncbi:helix-turn-helix domain-containing protein [Arthrobacter rhombi]|uniref:helix-turn-helix domain-containing protein n=1 Tax=Arthrobacter rhombi TaxID=71253 RepID=UPI003FD00AE5
MNGKQVMERRNSRGMSREELAARAGTDRKTIALYENEHITPESELLARIANILDIRPAPGSLSNPRRSRAGWWVLVAVIITAILLFTGCTGAIVRALSSPDSAPPDVTASSAPSSPAIRSQAPTPELLPTVTPSKPVEVYESTINDRLHRCDTAGAIHPNGEYECVIAVDGRLRWEDYYAEKSASEIEREAKDAAKAYVRPAPVPAPKNAPIDTYTGKRCYLPGGKTYRRC